MKVSHWLTLMNLIGHREALWLKSSIQEPNAVMDQLSLDSTAMLKSWSSWQHPFTGHTGGDKVNLCWKHIEVTHWTVFLLLTQASLNWAVSRLNDYLAWAGDSDIKPNGEHLVPKIFLYDGKETMSVPCLLNICLNTILTSFSFRHSFQSEEQTIKTRPTPC